MYITDSKELIKSFIQKGLVTKRYRPILVVGEMGIGKSQGAVQVAEELGWDYHALPLSMLSTEDLAGFPRLLGSVMSWAEAEWLALKKGKNLVLIVEELNRCAPDVQQAVFQMLTENRIHTHPLPENTQIVICINPPNDRYHTSELDPALLSRCCQIKVEANADVFLKYAYERKMNDKVIQFLSVNTELICKPTDTGGPNPRAWEYVSDMLDTIPERLQLETLTGWIGKEASVNLIKFMDKAYARPVTAKEVLADYPAVKDKLSKQKNDQTYITVKDIINSIGTVKLTKASIKHLGEFMRDIPDEWKVEMIKNMPQKTLGQISAEAPEFVKSVTAIAKELNNVK